MSGYVRPALISAIADSIGISDLSDEVARVLAPDVEYRVRDILQEARKFSHHGCRRRLECPDVNHALQARDMEQLYGVNPDDRRRYSQVSGAPEAFQIDDTLHRCQDIIHQPLPPPPVEVGVSMHWFLVNGIKPRIPENAVPSQLIQWHQDKIEQANSAEAASGGTSAQPAAAAVPTSAGAAAPDGMPGPTPAGASAGTAMIAALDNSGAPAVLMPVVKHSITEELSELLRICAKVLLEPTEEVGADHPVFATLAADAGLDAAVPYIVAMISRGARASPQDLPRLWRLLWAAQALVRNHSNNAAAYLSQLLPALLTLLLNNSLGPSGGRDHFRLRRQAAVVLGDVADRFPQPHLNIRARIAATCMKALRKRPVRLCTSYGALQGLQALGGRTLRLLLLPELADIHNALLPIIANTGTDHRSALKAVEAEHCLMALREAACAACRHGAAELSAAGLSAAAMARLAHIDSEAHGADNRGAEARLAAASAIDKRMQELESQAQKALVEGRQLREQRLQQVQALQRVEAAAKATLESGDASRVRSGAPAARPAGGAAAPPAEAVDATAAARAAARMAAESFDPARAGGTAIAEAGPVQATPANGTDAGGEAEAMESPPGSPLFVPPPPKSPVAASAPASAAQPFQAPPQAQAPAVPRNPDARLHPPGAAVPSMPPSQAQAMPVAAAPVIPSQAANASLHHHSNGMQLPTEAKPGPAPDAAPGSAASGAMAVPPQQMATNGHLGSASALGQKAANHMPAVAPLPIPSAKGNDMTHTTPSDNAAAKSTSSPRRMNSAPNNGCAPAEKAPKGGAAETGVAHSSVHRSAAQQAADPSMQQALKEGHAMGVHVAVVCELYGEAVLPWLGIDRVGGVFL
eukprot:jgi/Ulvmu1/10213/UM060_0013.1